MTSISKKLERVQLKDIEVKMIMPKKVLNQIKWLCKEIPKVEWSGILFYSLKGSIKDPENLEVHLEDILPMQKGTSTFTEYSFDERVVEHMMNNPRLEDCKIGHIHSHNTMGVYFSGTDWSELEDNAPNHNFYVSLIVNNYMDFCAKVCFIAKSNSVNFTAKDENGKAYNYTPQEEEVKEKLISYDCSIFSPNNKIEVSQTFGKQVEHIIEEASKKTSVTTYYGDKGSNSYTSSGFRKKATPQSQIEKKEHPGIDAWGDFGFNSRIIESTTEQNISEDTIEDFSLFVVNTGNDCSEFQSMSEILEFYRSFDVSPKALSAKILEKYTNIYNTFFDKAFDKDSPEMFAEVTEDLIEELKSELETISSVKTANMLKPTIVALENMLDKFNKYEFNTVK